MIESELRDRRFAPIVALSSFDPLQPPLSVKPDAMGEYLFSDAVAKPLTLSTAERIVAKFVAHETAVCLDD